MSKKAYFIITLLFGWCGAHKFMQKKYGMGFLYLCTFGLFCVGWIIDCILALLPLLHHSSSAPAPSSNNIAGQLCLAVDPAFVSEVLPMIKSGLSYGSIADAYRSSHPDSECDDLMLRIQYVAGYYSAASELLSLSECGASKYRIVCYDDADLCSVCRKFKGRALPVSGAKIGYNCPPFHLGCRCVIVIEN